MGRGGKEMGVVQYDEKKIDSFSERIKELEGKLRSNTVRMASPSVKPEDMDKLRADRKEITGAMRKISQEIWDVKSRPGKVASLQVLESHEKMLAESSDGKQFKMLKDDIEKFGIYVPIITNLFDRVIDGHRRLRAAQELGLDTVPVVRLQVADETEEEKIIYRIHVFRRVLDKSTTKAIIKRLVPMLRNPKGRPPKGSKGLTQKKVASDLGISRSAVAMAKQRENVTSVTINPDDPKCQLPEAKPSVRKGHTIEKVSERWDIQRISKWDIHDWVTNTVKNAELGKDDKYWVDVTIYMDRKE
jgi:hypothetical protein